MKDEIEVGEYVRTKKGKIFKYGKGRAYLGRDNEIINHSKNIIDLIEVGDYVNGKEVKYIVMFEGFPDYPKLIFVDETHLIPNETCKNEDIKTILTKELYEANCYKVRGKDE